MDKYDLLEKQIDWRNLLIGNYKSLGLKEEEVIMILSVQYALDQNEKTITPELLSLLTNYDINKTSAILTSLLNKSLIILENDDKNSFTTSLKGIKRILIDDFLKNKSESLDNSSLYSLFEKEFARPLSFAEVELLKSWINSKISEDKIKLALKQAISKNIRNMRYIDKILLSWDQEEERKSEGYTTISSSWRKDIKETLDSINEKENK